MVVTWCLNEQLTCQHNSNMQDTLGYIPCCIKAGHGSSNDVFRRKKVSFYNKTQDLVKNAGCMCKMGFLSGKTACLVGNVAMCVITVVVVDDNLASTVTMPTAAAVPGGGEDGHRTVSESIACSTQPCTGVIAGDSLVPTAVG